MEITKTYENYPPRIVVISNSVSILIYLSGFLIVNHLSWIAGISYLVFTLILEFRLLGKHCINCYYWGKICGFGKGRVSSLLFRKGYPSEFCKENFTWKDMIPDILVTLIPLIAAVLSMIISFNIIILIAPIVLIAASTFGNSIIRGQLTCKFCKQREKGCPAERLFAKS